MALLGGDVMIIDRDTFAVRFKIGSAAAAALAGHELRGPSDLLPLKTLARAMKADPEWIMAVMSGLDEAMTLEETAKVLDINVRRLRGLSHPTKYQYKFNPLYLPNGYVSRNASRWSLNHIRTLRDIPAISPMAAPDQYARIALTQGNNRSERLVSDSGARQAAATGVRVRLRHLVHRASRAVRQRRCDDPDRHSRRT